MRPFSGQYEVACCRVRVAIIKTESRIACNNAFQNSLLVCLLSSANTSSFSSSDIYLLLLNLTLTDRYELLLRKNLNFFSKERHMSSRMMMMLTMGHYCLDINVVYCGVSFKYKTANDLDICDSQTHRSL